MLQVNHNGSIYHESGEVVKVVEEAMYLGGLLISTADVRRELTRRLGEAAFTFKQLH